MEALQRSLNLLNTIDINNTEAISKIASTAYYDCEYCLEAAAIMSRFMDDVSREAFLFDAVNNVEFLIKENGIQDEDVKHSLLRGYFELGCLYFEYGSYLKAIHYYEIVKNLDIRNEFLVSYRLLSLYAFFENEEKIETLFNEITKSDDYDVFKTYLPYMVYLYKKGVYKGVYTCLKKLCEAKPNFIKLLNGEDIDDSALTKTMSNNAFLLNTCPRLIDFLCKAGDYLD